MALITITAFHGANLAFDPRLLGSGIGVASFNQRPGYDDLRPWDSTSASLATVPASPQRKTIYRMDQDVSNDAAYWLGWSSVVHAVNGYETDDTTERTYFTGDGSPKWTNNILALSGGPPYPQASRELAVPIPVAAPVVTLNTAGTTGTQQAFSYVYTFVNEIGWESAPSPVSNALLDFPASTFNLSGFDANPGGTFGVTLIRLYRFVAGTSSAGNFFFIREWSIGSPPANPIDDARAAATDPIPTEGWRPPPTDGHGLTNLWNGMLAMLTGKSVRISEPYKPYAYPLAYELALTHTGVAIGTFGQRMLVLTTGDAKVFVGSSPESMDEEPTKVNRACVSARSVVSFNEGQDRKGVVWSSDQGLCWYGEGGFRLLTEGITTREQWQTLAPSTIVAARYERYYFCTYDDGVSKKGFFIDPENPTGIYFLSSGFDAVYRDPLNDRMYLLEGANIKRWNVGSPMTTTFRSKIIRLPSATAISTIQVIANSYPATVTMWADGNQVYSGSIPSSSPVRVPSGWRAEELQFEVSATGRVLSIRAASTMSELRNA